MAELYKRIVGGIEPGDLRRDIAKRFSVDLKVVYQAQNLSEATGGYKKRNHGGQPRIARMKDVVKTVEAAVKADLNKRMA